MKVAKLHGRRAEPYSKIVIIGTKTSSERRYDYSAQIQKFPIYYYLDRYLIQVDRHQKKM